MQQTPKPLAQVPDLIPPLFSQSFELRQVPLLPLLLWQGSFLKETIVNSDKTEIKLIHSTFSFWLNHCIIRLETDYLPSEIGRLDSIKHIIKTFPPLEKWNWQYSFGERKNNILGGGGRNFLKIEQSYNCVIILTSFSIHRFIRDSFIDVWRGDWLIR